MFISKADLERRLESSKNIAVALGHQSAVVTTKKGKSQFTNDVDGVDGVDGASKSRLAKADKESNKESDKTKDLAPVVRRTVATLAAIDNHDNVATAFSEFKLTTLDIKNVKNAKDNRSVIEEAKARVSELALNQLLETLGLLTPDVVSGEKPKDIANIAANLSKIVTNLSPRQSTDEKSNVSVIFYAPQPRDEKSYTVIAV